MARIHERMVLDSKDMVFLDHHPPELDLPPEDPYASHLVAAWEFYGRPFYCATIGDTIGNAIARKAADREDILQQRNCLGSEI